MTESDALHITRAADHDPILASWAAVLHEHGMTSVDDVCPYEAWEIYQGFYNYGFVTTSQFNSTSQQFFSKSKPAINEIQRVLCRIEAFYTEPTMPTDSNPFADSNQSLSVRKNREVSSTIVQRQKPTSLGNPFQEQSNLPARTREHDREIFSQPQGGLPCHDGGRRENDSVMIGGVEYQPEVYCHSKLVDMTQNHSLGVDGDLDTELVLAVFEGVCEVCGFLHHNSVSRLVDPGANR